MTASAEVARFRRHVDRRPPLRQAPPESSAPTGERPWWAKTPREGLTAEAERQRERMGSSRLALKVDGSTREE